MKNFKPQKMVGWFDVGQLAGTAVRSILSSIFGTRADKRETFAALTPCETYSTNAEENEVWLDYISDSGDGFDPTYSMMRLISEEKIAVHHNGENKNLKRGNIVVFGGDQVYPAPTMEEYENRFIGPLENASQHANRAEQRIYMPFQVIMIGMMDYIISLKYSAVKKQLEATKLYKIEVILPFNLPQILGSGD